MNFLGILLLIFALGWAVTTTMTSRIDAQTGIAVIMIVHGSLLVALSIKK